MDVFRKQKIAHAFIGIIIEFRVRIKIVRALYALDLAGKVAISINDGISWTRTLSKVPTTTEALSISVSQNGTIYVGDRNGDLWVSSDGGSAWSEIVTPWSGTLQINSIFLTNDIIYAGLGNGSAEAGKLAISKNNGTNWSYASALPDYPNAGLGGVSVMNNTIYIADGVPGPLGSVDIYICPECRCASARIEARGAPGSAQKGMAEQVKFSEATY